MSALDHLTDAAIEALRAEVTAGRRYMDAYKACRDEQAPRQSMLVPYAAYEKIRACNEAAEAAEEN